MQGRDLFEEVFNGEIDHLYEIDDMDEVTAYREVSTSRDGWYFENTYEFRYHGKKYAFEVRDHASDNVSDTTYLMDSFREVIPHHALDEAIEKIIHGIEDEHYSTLEEIIEALEELKQNFDHLVEY